MKEWAKNNNYRVFKPGKDPQEMFDVSVSLPSFLKWTYDEDYRPFSSFKWDNGHNRWMPNTFLPHCMRAPGSEFVVWV